MNEASERVSVVSSTIYPSVYESIECIPNVLYVYCAAHFQDFSCRFFSFPIYAAIGESKEKKQFENTNQKMLLFFFHTWK